MNFEGAMKFINSQAKRSYGQESSRLLEKRIINLTIAQISGKFEAQKSLHKDLLRRIQRLEMAIRSERMKRMLKETGEKEPPAGDIESLNKSEVNQEPPRQEGNGLTLAQFQSSLASSQDRRANLINKVKDILQWKPESRPKPDNAKRVADMLETAFHAYDNKSARANLKTVDSLKFFPHLGAISNMKIYSPVPQKRYLFSCSEDAIIQIYEYNSPVLFTANSIQQFCHGTLPKLQKDAPFQRGSSSLQNPLFKLRKHKSPVLSLCLAKDTFLTGDMRGNIMRWKLPLLSERNDAEMNADDLSNPIKSYDIEAPVFLKPISTSGEPVWELHYNSFTEAILAIRGADGAQIINSKYSTVFSKSLLIPVEKEVSPPENDSFTCGCWLDSDIRKYMVGVRERPVILLYSRTYQDPLVAMEYNIGYEQQFQPNCLSSHSLLNLVCGGFQDGAIRIFNPLGPACIASRHKAHSGSVSSIAQGERETEFISVGQDGKVKLWDLRRFEDGEPLAVLNLQRPLSALVLNREDSFFFTGGVDGSIGLHQQSLYFERD